MEKSQKPYTKLKKYVILNLHIDIYGGRVCEKPCREGAVKLVVGILYSSLLHAAGQHTGVFCGKFTEAGYSRHVRHVFCVPVAGSCFDVFAQFRKCACGFDMRCRCAVMP